VKYRLIVAALLLSWPALAQDAGVPADVPAAVPVVETPVVTPMPEVALPSVDVPTPAVETPIVDMTSPVVAPDIPMDIPAPDIGASVATPDVGIAPAIETPAMAPAPEIALPSVEVGAPAIEPSVADVSPPALAPVEPLSFDAGFKSGGPPEHSGDHGNPGGPPEIPQTDISIDVDAIGKGGSAHAEGGDATNIVKNDNDISSVNINKDGDVSNTNILKPEIETTTIIKNEDKNVNINNNTDYTKVDTKINVEVKPDIVVKPEIELKQTTIVQGSVAQKQSTLSELTPLIAVGVAALALSRNGSRDCGGDCGHRRHARQRYYTRRAARAPTLKGSRPDYGGNYCQEGERYEAPNCVPTNRY
jgi:hypothetical protein